MARETQTIGERFRENNFGFFNTTKPEAYRSINQGVGHHSSHQPIYLHNVGAKTALYPPSVKSGFARCLIQPPLSARR